MAFDLDQAKPVKPRRGIGDAVTRQRRYARDKFEQEKADRIKKEKEAARDELQRLKERAHQVEKQGYDEAAWQASLLRSVVSNQTALLRVWGFDQSVESKLTDSANVNAWTDFKKIAFGMPKAMMPKRLDVQATLDTVALMKGVMQHEMGHLRFTTSFLTIWKNTNLDKSGHPKGMLHKCWNMLEDMRMETCVVDYAKRIRQYFGVMVADVVLAHAKMEQSWLMLAGRAYLPTAVLRKSYVLFDEFCEEGGIHNGAFTWFNLVQDYASATTEQELADAIVAAYEFILQVKATLPNTMDDMSQMENNEGTADPSQSARQKSNITDMFGEQPKRPKSDKKKDKDDFAPSSPSDDEGGDDQDSGQDEGDDGSDSGSDGSESDDEGQDGTGKGKGDDDGSEGEGAGDDDDADGEGTGDSKDSDGKPSKGCDPNGKGGETFNQDDWSAEGLKDDFNNMKDTFQHDLRHDLDVLDMARTAREKVDNKEGSGLPDFPSDPPYMNDEMQKQCEYFTRGIEAALNTFVTDSAPMWHNHTQKGVIDALAYRTKQVGALDYRRLLDDRGFDGLDVHVSVLADISPSMAGGPVAALSQAVFSFASACERVNIGSTFTLWSSGANGQWRIFRDKIQPFHWPTTGGTDPRLALDDLDTHNPEEAENHLVIIFTDGAWGNFPSLRQWDAPGRTIVIIRYASYDGAVQKDMGAHAHVHINDMNQLVDKFTESLVDVLAKKKEMGE